MLLTLCIMSIQLHCTMGYSSGNIPLSACDDMLPRHTPNNPSDSTNPYTIALRHRTYIPGKKLSVNLRSSDSQLSFMGFYVQARTVGNGERVGSFSDNDGLFNTHQCTSTAPESLENTVSHSQQFSSNPRPSTLLEWYPPQSIDSDVYIQGTFVKSYSEFWTGRRSAVLQSILAHNASECCRLDLPRNSPEQTVCSSVDHNGNLNISLLQSIVSFTNMSAFSLLRCWFWSSSSSTCQRNSLQGIIMQFETGDQLRCFNLIGEIRNLQNHAKNCCERNSVASECRELCEAGDFVNFNREANDDLQRCIQNTQFLSCIASKGCGVNEECASDEGECVCETGFERNESSICVDIDECLTDEANCSSMADCVNTDGGHICQCKNGTTGDGESCSTIHNCDSFNCSVHATCLRFSNGSYGCVCYDGFFGDGLICSDIDECMGGAFNHTSNLNNCSAYANCRNFIGGYSCICFHGFSGNGNVCADIDECTTDQDICSPLADCVNIVGSFLCQCKNGTTGDGKTCSIVPDCSTLNCSDYATCSQLTDESFECRCDDGFTGDGHFCSDINECVDEMSNCPLNSNCENLFGSYSCPCLTGFANNGLVCADIDECNNELHNCSINSDCYNLPGFFECSCKIGFSGNGYTCTDIDECTFSPPVCSPNANCTNTFGGYMCECNFGFVGNGTVCEEIVFPSRSIGYNIISTIHVDVTSNMHEFQLIDQLEKTLLIPALSSLPNYHSIQLVKATRGSLIVISQGVFVITNSTTEYPSLSNVEESINERAMIINYNLPMGTNQVPVDPNFVVSRAARNGLCQSAPCSNDAPPSYKVTCVEVGNAEFSCICIDNVTLDEILCSTIQASTTRLPMSTKSISMTRTDPQNGGILHPGAIVAIVIGVLLAVVCLGICVYCFMKKKRKGKKNVHETYDAAAYVNPDYNYTNGDPIYMEIKPSRPSLPTNDGDYIDISDAYYDVTEDQHTTVPPKSNLESTAGYEFAEDLKSDEAKQTKKMSGKNKSKEGRTGSTKPPVSRMDSDGYLTPTGHKGESKTDNEYDVYQRS